MSAYEMRISDWSSDVCSSYLVGQREFGRILVDIAQRRDADRLAERRGGDAKVGGQVEPRRDDDLRPRNIALDARGPDFLQPLHLVDDRQRMLLERHRIVATDDEGDVPARKTARLALERQERVDIGRAHGRTPVTKANLVCRHMNRKKKNKTKTT